jgi:disks large protein 1
METLFPSNGSYQVRTMVNNSPLEECSLIRSNDKIRPYFAVSVANDPDLIGLLVYVQDSSENVIGNKVQYTLLPYARETALTEEELAALLEEANPDEDTKAEASGPVPELPEILEVAVKSFSSRLPYFPLPKELKIGPYTLVFEAVGKKETLSHMEANVYYLGGAAFDLKDMVMYLSGLSGPQLISPETSVLLEASFDFDRRLDPYVIWYSGKNIISEGLMSDGAGKILWKAPEEAGFYPLRLEAFPVYLKRSAYNGFSREINLPVSPRAVSLGYFFTAGEVSRSVGDMSRSIGDTSRSVGDTSRNVGDMSRSVGDMSRSVGDTSRNIGDMSRSVGDTSYPATELFQWYQFDGSLFNALSVSNEQTLLPAHETRPRWLAAGQSYGLAVGPDDPYRLSPVNFFREKEDQGGGVLLLHIRPLSQGIIFSAFFPPKSSSTGGVWMYLIREENVIALRLSAGDTFIDLPARLAPASAEGLVPIAVEFYIRPYQMEAKISMDENAQNKAGGIRLAGALSGEGRITLGGVADRSMPNLTQYPPEKIPADSAEETVKTFLDTVWDELAILFSAAPLLPEELPEPAVRQNTAANNESYSIYSSQEQETRALTVLSENF